MDVKIRNLKKRYGEETILEIPELHFPKGSLTGLLGDNGAGKTTLLNIMSGLDRRFQGDLLFDGRKDRVKSRRDMIMVRCRPYLLKRSVYANIEFPLKLRRVGRSVRMDKVNDLIREFGIEGIRNQNARTLSGGELQKVVLARALVSSPRLLLLDETTTNIHADAIRDIEGIIQSFHKKTGCTIIFVTHNHSQAERLCDNLIVLEKKRPGKSLRKAAFVSPGRGLFSSLIQAAPENVQASRQDTAKEGACELL